MADHCITANPDIAGIGIRFNFYTTILAIILTRENKYTKELLCGIYKNAVINGLGILLTAVIQTVQKKLDLYHAIVVTYILFYLNIAFLFGQRKFVWDSQTNFQIFVFLLMHTFGVIVFFIWFLYAAIEGNKFGSQPSCNSLINFVFIFANVRATETWFRIIMVMYFLAAIPFALLILGFLILAPVRWTQRCTNALDKLFKRHPRLRVVRYVLGIPLAVYIISNLELIVYYNRSIIQPGENEWGFGQIIAVILTLGIFIDMAAAIRERHERHTERKPVNNSEHKLESQNNSEQQFPNDSKTLND